MNKLEVKATKLVRVPKAALQTELQVLPVVFAEEARECVFEFRAWKEVGAKRSPSIPTSMFTVNVVGQRHHALLIEYRSPQHCLDGDKCWRVDHLLAVHGRPTEGIAHVFRRPIINFSSGPCYKTAEECWKAGFINLYLEFMFEKTQRALKGYLLGKEIYPHLCTEVWPNDVQNAKLRAVLFNDARVINTPTL